jgi:HD superfamily phosphohydrolase
MNDLLDESRTDPSQLIVHDPIHGSFALPPLAWHIIDTVEFQRLRNIKQTGNTCYVYPGAEHTRFQHCLGVAHLSYEFGQTIKLKAKAPDMITDHQILLLCIAGLCHDLGHCAFSHLYDACIIPMFMADTDDSTDTASVCIDSHELASYLILKRIWKRIEYVSDSLTHDDIKMIGKMILGSPDKVPSSLRDELKWTRYDQEHAYLYEVVSNDRTGIDVDKFDYLKRDSHYTGIPCTFDPQRLMNFVTLRETETGHVIDYIRKSDELISSMWLSRDDLHRRAYQHRVSKCVDLMTVEMIKRCADCIIPGTKVPLREAHNDLDSYLLLTDAKITSMAESEPKAREILNMIQNRDLWPTVATVVSTKLLTFQFTVDIRTSKSVFRDNYVYYIYDASESELDTQFYTDLITQAEGGEIRLRSGK